jgi:hypothetical protein
LSKLVVVGAKDARAREIVDVDLRGKAGNRSRRRRRGARLQAGSKAEKYYHYKWTIVRLGEWKKPIIEDSEYE